MMANAYCPPILPYNIQENRGKNIFAPGLGLQRSPDPLAGGVGLAAPRTPPRLGLSSLGSPFALLWKKILRAPMALAPWKIYSAPME